MLVLTRKTGEKIQIGENITITVLKTQGKRVQLGISAPHDVSIHRQEIHSRISEENADQKREAHQHNI